MPMSTFISSRYVTRGFTQADASQLPAHCPASELYARCRREALTMFSRTIRRPYRHRDNVARRLKNTRANMSPPQEQKRRRCKSQTMSKKITTAAEFERSQHAMFIAARDGRRLNMSCRPNRTPVRPPPMSRQKAIPPHARPGTPTTPSQRISTRRRSFLMHHPPSVVCVWEGAAPGMTSRRTPPDDTRSLSAHPSPGVGVEKNHRHPRQRQTPQRPKPVHVHGIC